MKWGALLTVVFLGCAEDPVTTASGARLELVWHAFEDGSRQLDTAEVLDTERGERCTPRRWTDGNTYCTPGGRGTLATVYTSAACDTTALRAGDGGSAAYAATIEAGAIAALHHTAPVELTAYWVRDLDGACTGPHDGSGQRFYQPAAPVAPVELARVESRAIDGSGRVGLRAHVSDDGLSLPHGLRDAAHDFDCIVRTTANGVATCLPPRQGALRFADAACRAPVVGQHASWPDVAPYVFAGPVCDPRGYMVGIELPTAPGYELIAGACVATAAPVGHRWFEAASIDLARVERRRIAAPEHRLEAIELVAGDLTLAVGNRFDTGTGGECHLAASATEPGVRRCLPEDPGYEHAYYTDATCSRRVQLADVYREAPMAKCGAELPPFAVSAATPGVYYRIEDSQTAPVFRRDENGACTAAPYVSLAGAPQVFQLGEPVAPDVFVAARAE